MKIFSIFVGLIACIFAPIIFAQSTADSSPTRAVSGSTSPIQQLPEIVVNASATTAESASSLANSQNQTPPIKKKYQLPQSSESITAKKIFESVNIVDPEDAIKYFPSLFVRKRNNGDTQPTLETRTWGVNSSARSLVYADDILLSALISNNNTTGAPRWGLVSPEEIARIDFLYGPFAAAYPGNSMGGVLIITTKMPKKFVTDFSQSDTFQTFGMYDTKGTFDTHQPNLSLGDKIGNVSYLVTANYQHSDSQPLIFITDGSIPKNTTGAISALNKLGAPANVVGAGGLLQSDMANVNGKVAWNITPSLTAKYDLGLWFNNTDSSVQTYLRNANGDPTFAGISGFASNDYTLEETHMMNAISLTTNTQGAFDWDFSLSNYYYLEDIQRNPFTASSTDTSLTTNGKITRMDGTNWTNGDLKGIWRPTWQDNAHEISFGLHSDRYELDNPTYATPNWNGGPDSSSSLYSDSEGVTTTEALWAQDAWKFVKNFKLTLGGRLEFWQADDGFNLATKTTNSGAITSTTAENQPDLNAIRFSPKVSLSWTPAPKWKITGSFGQAYRFPTVSELYQIVSTGPQFSIPNPNLKPEEVLSEELALERSFKDGHVRLSLFNENVNNALISQTGYLAGQTPYNFVTNVNAIRNTGVELAAQKDNVLIRGVTLFGSVTYVNSEILSDPSWVSANHTTVVGKRVPYVPDWRATLGVTLHPTSRLALTTAFRYSGQQFSTLDNTDTTAHVFGAFDSFLVVDVRAQYKINAHTFVDLGIDNLTNSQYFLYHPFPMRTYTASVRVLF